MTGHEQFIPVTWQGRFSRALLAASQQGVIAGVTSRGIFIKLDSNWILFLSYESFRGPLTLNLSGENLTLEGVATNQTVIHQDGKLLIPSAGIEIDYRRAEVWEAPPRPGLLLPAGDRASSLKTVARLILSQGKEPGLYLVLNEMLGLNLIDLQPPPTALERVDCTLLLQRLNDADLDVIFSTLAPFLGLGTGLTPAGDDLILGLLLAYHRWGSVLKPSFNTARLNDLLVQAASQKTTLLSANLIACAAQGQADERLTNALDGIMTGSPAPEQCARSLSAWGNTSGCEALAGMALAILSANLSIGCFRPDPYE